MNTTQKIFNKLSDGKKSTASKKELSKKTKVDLSLVDDTQTDLEWLNEYTGLASYYAYERLDEMEEEYENVTTPLFNELDELAINSEVRMIEEQADILTEKLDKIQAAAEELGIEPNEVYDNYDEARKGAVGSKEVYEDLVRKYRDVARYFNRGEFLSKKKK